MRLNLMGLLRGDVDRVFGSEHMSEQGSASIDFFATGDDLKALFQDVEAKARFLYTRAGRLRGETADAYETGAALPNLGRASSDQSINCDTYLVAPSGARIIIRKIDARAGTILTVDQLENPDTITLNVGGLFSPTVLLAGNLGAAHDTPTSRALLASWDRAVRKRWTQRHEFFVGDGALQLLRAGGRLTQSADAPPEYDLS